MQSFEVKYRKKLTGCVLTPIANPKGIKYIQQENHQKYEVISDILYSWYKKSEVSDI